MVEVALTTEVERLKRGGQTVKTGFDKRDFGG